MKRKKYARTGISYIHIIRGGDRTFADRAQNQKTKNLKKKSKSLPKIFLFSDLMTVWVTSIKTIEKKDSRRRRRRRFFYCFLGCVWPFGHVVTEGIALAVCSVFACVVSPLVFVGSLWGGPATAKGTGRKRHCVHGHIFHLFLVWWRSLSSLSYVMVDMVPCASLSLFSDPLTFQF